MPNTTGSVASQQTPSNLNYNHHDKRYASASAPISQKNNFQFSNSVQIASQNTMISSNKDGYESDRSMNSAPVTSHSSHNKLSKSSVLSSTETFG